MINKERRKENRLQEIAMTQKDEERIHNGKSCGICYLQQYCQLLVTKFVMSSTNSIIETPQMYNL
jgi:hypothetical protein